MNNKEKALLIFKMLDERVQHWRSKANHTHGLVEGTEARIRYLKDPLYKSQEESDDPFSWKGDSEKQRELQEQEKELKWRIPERDKAKQEYDDWTEVYQYALGTFIDKAEIAS